MVGADPTRSSDTAAVKQSHPSISGIKTFRIQNGRMLSVFDRSPRIRNASSFGAVLRVQAISGDENRIIINRCT
jgi:hypothetical protein